MPVASLLLYCLFTFIGSLRYDGITVASYTGTNQFDKVARVVCHCELQELHAFFFLGEKRQIPTNGVKKGTAVDLHVRNNMFHSKLAVLNLNVQVMTCFFTKKTLNPKELLSLQ